MPQPRVQPSPQMASWPIDHEGTPMTLVSMGAQELIGLKNYSNVTVGPALVTKFVPDDPDAILEGLRDCVRACEQIIAEERDVILKLINGK